MKRIILLGMTLGATLLVLPMFAAFEAHVVNVTATIDNALTVPISEIKFGEVFPQQTLHQPLAVGLSESFLATSRVDDVNYFIRQKPKCQADSIETQPQFAQVFEDPQSPDVFQCPSGYHKMPLLCPYLSKHELTTDGTAPNGENDSKGQDAFHGPITLADWTLSQAKSYDSFGHLQKSQGDTADNWDIDLHTPCFEGECAQDWASYVAAANTLASPADYIQPQSDKGQMMGCDLWLEVDNISYPHIGCDQQLDLMLVLDRSGSEQGSPLGLLQSSTNAFVTALAPTPAGVHIGQVSFADNATFDQNLTGTESLIHTSINSLVAGGLTNIAGGINVAQSAFGISNTPPERPGIKNVMILVTDGNPTTPDVPTGQANAIAAANAAKAAGTTIFVVGVGNGVDTNFLQNSIATDPAHYFAVASFADLQTALLGIAQCTQ